MVWQGSAGDRRPYADQTGYSGVTDSKTVEFVNYLQEVPSAPRDAVKGCHEHHAELLSTGVHHERIETGTPRFLSANTTIFVFVDNLEAALSRQFSEIVQLRFDMLVGDANSDVNCGSQWVPPESGLGKPCILSTGHIIRCTASDVNSIMSYGQNAI